jgi:hypothetical protein
MALQFLSGIEKGAIERGDHGLRLCSDNAREAILDLSTALEEIAALSGDHRARGIALRALGRE